MKIKYLLIIMLIFIAVGCTTEYRLEIKEDLFEEKIIFTIPNNYDDSFLNEIIDTSSILNGNMEGDGSAPFEKEREFGFLKEVKNKSKYKEIILTKSYTEIEFTQNPLFELCFENVAYQRNIEYYHISITGSFNCIYDNENIKVTFSTDGQIISSNADTRSRRNHTWNITESNKEDININFQVARPIEIKSNFWIFILIIVVIGLGITGYKLYPKFRQTQKKVNKETPQFPF